MSILTRRDESSAGFANDRLRGGASSGRKLKCGEKKPGPSEGGNEVVLTETR